MVDDNLHIIHCIETRIDCNSSHLHTLNNVGINQIIKSVVDEVESELNELGNNESVNIDELTIDVQISNVQYGSLKETIKESLKSQLLNIIMDDKLERQAGKAIKAKALSPFEILLYFLQNGNLPWFAKEVTLCTNEYGSERIDIDLIQPISKVLRAHPTAISRLVNQFEHKEVIQFLTLLTNQSFAIEVSTLLKMLESTSSKYSKIFDIGHRINNILLGIIFAQVTKLKLSTGFSLSNWDATLKLLLSNSIKHYPSLDLMIFEEAILETNNKKLLPSIEIIREINTSRDFSSFGSEHHFEQEVNNNSINQSKEKNSDKSDNGINSRKKKNRSNRKSDANSSAMQSGDSIQVFNAGVILLHPFIPSFFEKVGLIHEGEFISEDCQQRAICLLHFIATGSLKFEEQLLTFQKFLCNYDLDKTIPLDLPISQFEKDEVNKLLEAVLNHWTSMKGNSPNGLRGNFLIRKGVLQKDGNDIIIHVEQNTADILLGNLPWSLNYAKWSWMAQLLTIKWA